MGKTGNNQEELLKSALAAIEKEYGKGSIMTLGSRERVSIDVISSGSLALDRALGIGGYPKGRVIEIFGPRIIRKDYDSASCSSRMPKERRYVRLY